MSPRRATFFALAVLVGAAGQPASAAGDDVAAVNGVAISADEFTDALEAAGAGAGEFVEGDAARALLSSMIVNESMRQFLADNAVVPAQRASAELASQFGAPYATTQAFLAQLADVELPEVDEVRDAYLASPAGLGIVCVRAIVAADAAAANEIVAALADGGDFADLGIQFSMGPELAVTGGSITPDPDFSCVERRDVPLSGEQLAALVDGQSPGVPFIVQDTVVVMVSPYDEVAATIQAYVAFTEFLAGVDVTVDPRYGRWDIEAGSVVALGAP